MLENLSKEKLNTLMERGYIRINTVTGVLYTKETYNEYMKKTYTESVIDNIKPGERPITFNKWCNINKDIIMRIEDLIKKI